MLISVHTPLHRVWPAGHVPFPLIDAFGWNGFVTSSDACAGFCATPGLPGFTRTGWVVGLLAAAGVVALIARGALTLAEAAVWPGTFPEVLYSDAISPWASSRVIRPLPKRGSVLLVYRSVALLLPWPS